LRDPGLQGDNQDAQQEKISKMFGRVRHYILAMISNLFETEYKPHHQLDQEGTCR